jgi:hypothetical protein
MAFDFPGDDRLEGLWAQYMYGPNLLVAPVVESARSSKKVVLPEGNWMLIHGGCKVYEGPAEVEIPAPVNFIPVLMREGAIITYGDVVQGNNNWTENWSPKLRIEVYPGRKDSRFDYWNRKAVVPVKCEVTGKGCRISLDDPGHPGEVVVYCVKPKSVKLGGRELAMGKDCTHTGNRLTVPFEGKVSLEVSGAAPLSPENTKLDIPAALAVEPYAPPPKRGGGVSLQKATVSLVPLAEGVKVYLDREHTLTRYPGFLKGATLIQTMNDQKRATREKFLRLKTGNATEVFVAYDGRSSGRPDWMKDFKDTGEVVRTSESKNKDGYRLYVKTFYAGEFFLGGNHARGSRGADSNYFGFMKAAE